MDVVGDLEQREQVSMTHLRCPPATSTDEHAQEAHDYVPAAGLTGDLAVTRELWCRARARATKRAEEGKESSR